MSHTVNNLYLIEHRLLYEEVNNLINSTVKNPLSESFENLIPEARLVAVKNLDSDASSQSFDYFVASSAHPKLECQDVLWLKKH